MWADSAYRVGALAAWIAAQCRWVLEVVGQAAGADRRSRCRKWRWIVERTFGWFGRYRRLSKDYEHNPASSEAWIYIAMIHRMSRFSLPEQEQGRRPAEAAAKTPENLISRRPVTRTVKANPQTHYSLSNAGPEVPLSELVRVRFTRHRIEEVFGGGEG